MADPRPIRLLLADGQPMLRTGLRTLLATEEGLDVVGEAGHGDEIPGLCRRLQPDVVLMDLRLPPLDGIFATRAIIAAGLPVGVLILAALDRSTAVLDEQVVAALRAGATGFLGKDTPTPELVAAIRAVSAGEAVIGPPLLRRLLERALPGLADPAPQRGLDSLTERERQVLVHVARGLSNAEIAAELRVSETTVKTHVRHVLIKLGLRDRIRAVIFAYDSGLVRPRR